MSGKITLEKYAEIKSELNRYPDHDFQVLANRFSISRTTLKRINKTEDYVGYRKYWKDEYQHRLKNYYRKWADEIRFEHRFDSLKVVLVLIVAVLAVLYTVYLIGGIK